MAHILRRLASRSRPYDGLSRNRLKISGCESVGRLWEAARRECLERSLDCRSRSGLLHMYHYMSQLSARTCGDIDWDSHLRDRYIRQAQSCEVAWWRVGYQFDFMSSVCILYDACRDVPCPGRAFCLTLSMPGSKIRMGRRMCRSGRRDCSLGLKSAGPHDPEDCSAMAPQIFGRK